MKFPLEIAPPLKTSCPSLEERRRTTLWPLAPSNQAIVFPQSVCSMPQEVVSLQGGDGEMARRKEELFPFPYFH